MSNLAADWGWGGTPSFRFNGWSCGQWQGAGVLDSLDVDDRRG
jgi:hypothetical protein